MFRRQQKFPERDSYNRAMVTFRAPSGASQEFAHAIELVNRDLEVLLDNLDTHRQHEFWIDLHGFALARIREQPRVAPLVVGDQVNDGVRQALQMFDEKTTAHLRAIGDDDRERFWHMLHEVSEEQARETKHPKARHGGGDL